MASSCFLFTLIFCDDIGAFVLRLSQVYFLSHETVRQWHVKQERSFIPLRENACSAMRHLIHEDIHVLRHSYTNVQIAHNTWSLADKVPAIKELSELPHLVPIHISKK